jgi:hypothetical protein
MGFFSKPKPILLGTCELSAKEASEKLARALLPPEWQGKGTVGQFENNAGWLEYRSPYYRYGCGLRLSLALENSAEDSARRNKNDNEYCLLKGQWAHPKQFLIGVWMVATAFLALDGLMQTLNLTFLFSTTIPPTVVATSWLFLFVGLFFLRWSHVHEKEALLQFLNGTLPIAPKIDS